MKIRSLLTIVAMLSVVLIGIGTAQAITGVNDDVPGQDIVIPMICEGHRNPAVGNTDAIFGGLNTLWAIAETSGGESCDASDSVCVPDASSKHNWGVAYTRLFIKDKTSVVQNDIDACWSRYDVVSSDCQSEILKMDYASQGSMELVIGGITYFVGYAEYKQEAACDTITDRFVSWVYFTDIARGFASGFNGLSFEGGEGPMMEEFCTDGSCSGSFIGVTARYIFPRYFILNGDSNSFNLWMLMFGRNQKKFGLNEFARTLECFFCDENENCTSNSIPIPWELNFVNPAEYIPGSVFPFSSYPKAGFAYCTIEEGGFLQGENDKTTIAGTLDTACDTPGDPAVDCETYSFFGWSYQRAVPISAQARVAAVHPIHRLYCQGDAGSVTELPERFDTGTVAECTVNGPLP